MPCYTWAPQACSDKGTGHLPSPENVNGRFASIFWFAQKTTITAISHDSAAQNIPKLRLRLGLSPVPCWEAYSASHTSKLDLSEPLRGEGGQSGVGKRKGWERGKRKGEEERMGRKEK